MLTVVNKSQYYQRKRKTIKCTRLVCSVEAEACQKFRVAIKLVVCHPRKLVLDIEAPRKVWTAQMVQEKTLS